MRVSDGRYVLDNNEGEFPIIVRFDQDDRYIEIHQNNVSVLVPHDWVEALRKAIDAGTYEATGEWASAHQKRRLSDDDES